VWLYLTCYVLVRFSYTIVCSVVKDCQVHITRRIFPEIKHNHHRVQLKYSLERASYKHSLVPIAHDTQTYKSIGIINKRSVIYDTVLIISLNV